MDLSLSLKTLGQNYIKLDEFFKTAEEQDFILKGINCTLTPSYKLKYILIIEKADDISYCIELDELEDFTQALVSEFQATLEAEVEGYALNLLRGCTTAMVELIIS